MISLEIDLSAILDLDERLREKAEIALRQAAQDLTTQTHAHILEQVQSKLHSSREKYVKALSFRQINDSTWVVALDPSAMWIEEGMPEHEMIDNLLKSKKTKTAKDGSRYLAVPFQHNKGPTSQTPAAQDLTATIKKELKKRGIPYGTLEKDASGQPKIGLLHSFDITKEPIKTHHGPGQGKGPIGQVRQGMTGIPFLQGIRIYQRLTNTPNGPKVTRHIMTFRTASSKHKGTGRWVHPGVKAHKFFDEAAEWALKQWEQQIMPKILEDVAKTI